MGAHDLAHNIYLSIHVETNKNLENMATWARSYCIFPPCFAALRRSFSYLLFAFKSLMVLLKGFKTVFIVNIDAIVW